MSLSICPLCCGGIGRSFVGAFPPTHDFILKIILGSILMRAVPSSDRIFRSRHRTSEFSVHTTDPSLLSDHLPAK